MRRFDELSLDGLVHPDRTTASAVNMEASNLLVFILKSWIDFAGWQADIPKLWVHCFSMLRSRKWVASKKNSFAQIFSVTPCRRPLSKSLTALLPENFQRGYTRTTPTPKEGYGVRSG